VIDEPSLRRALCAADPGWRGELVVLSTTGSTSDDAKRIARAGAAHGSIVIAGEQTQGRGRNGSVWYSPAADNVYLSIVLRPAWPSAGASSFALVVGLVVASVVDGRLSTRAPAAVKWPNDVLIAGKKIAGVLVEAQLRGAEIASIVVGIGINVGTLHFPEPIAAAATSFAREGARDVDRAALVAALVSGVLAGATAFEADGLAPFLAQLSARDALRGRRVRVDQIAGIAAGLDASGCLLIETGGGVHSVTSGHVEIDPR
jgi:BirA family biotin operon repressor/biotin-[acetyl-CoA-carboxylase] ligase